MRPLIADNRGRLAPHGCAHTGHACDREEKMMTIPIWLKELGSSRRRRLLVIGGAVLTLGAGTVGVATPSGALRPDPPGDSVAAGAASAGVAPSAAVAAASDASPSATLTGLVYTFPAGSGGSLVRPLGISAFQGHVYVSNTSDNVLSDLNGGNTNTIAGSLEASGENGDGGPANLATLLQPTGTAEDASGNIYIADTEDAVIRRIDAASGTITRFAGTGQAGATGPGGPATQTRLDAPRAVAVNSSGDVFIADSDNNRVDEVLPNGHIVSFAGNGKPGYTGDGGAASKAELTEPTGVAVDSADNVYIADAGNNVIRRVDAQ